jgi:NTE family protein
MEPSTTPYGFETFLPKPRSDRAGAALCLSGGGHRAALFHLGATRRLNELGILAGLDTITSVSGGSIFAGFVASRVAERDGRWPAPGREWDDVIAAPVRKLAGTDLRSRPALAGLRLPNWFRRTAQVDAFTERLAKECRLGRLTDLPPKPRFVFCATDAVFRTGWTFDTGTRRVGGPAAGWCPVGNWPTARAVAASSCLPGVFPAMPINTDPAALTGGEYDRADRDELVGGLELTDGGMYDNLGLEPVWRDHQTILVSSAAPSFLPDPPAMGALWPLLRNVVVLLEQATDVRKRWLIASFIKSELEGTYWGIDSLPRHYGNQLPDGVYSDDLIRDVISQVRIDLDRFSKAEIAVLENHGYLMAEVAVRKHADGLIESNAPLAVPHPGWLDEARVREDLADSARTHLFSRSDL